MKIHELKTWPEQFSMLLYGCKPFEVRKNDRDYKVGDYLLLREYDPETSIYSGACVFRMVSSILIGGQFGIEKDYIIMTLTMV